MLIINVLFFGGIILLLIWVVIFLIKKVNKNKTIATSIPPTRTLNKEDLKAIKYVDLEANLSVNLLLNPKIPKGKLQTSVWVFDNISFYVSSSYRYRRIIHQFALSINEQIIEVIVPDVFLPYLYEGELYNNKTIEILYRKEFFVLYSIHGLIGYPELYKKFQLNGGYDGEYLLKRPATKEEQEAFITSKWTSIWGVMAPIIFPMSILVMMHEGLGLSIIFLPFILIVGIPLRIAYQKRKKYIESRMVYTLKGKISYDEDRFLYRINDTELILHRKWKKVFKKTIIPIEDAEMEVIVHTFDTLDQTARLRLQPISIKSRKLNINEASHKSTRGWTLPLYFAMASSFIAYLAPLQDFVLVDLRKITFQTEDLIFKLLMTVIWWTSIGISIYLINLIYKRIQGNYFNSEI